MKLGRGRRRPGETREGGAGGQVKLGRGRRRAGESWQGVQEAR